MRWFQNVTLYKKIKPINRILVIKINLYFRSQYGLYSAFMGCFMYCIFGSVKDITVGPTAIMALLTSEHVNKGPGQQKC